MGFKLKNSKKQQFILDSTDKGINYKNVLTNYETLT